MQDRRRCEHPIHPWIPRVAPCTKGGLERLTYTVTRSEATEKREGGISSIKSIHIRSEGRTQGIHIAGSTIREVGLVPET